MKVSYIQPTVKCVSDVDDLFMSNVSKFQIGDDGKPTDIEDVDPDEIIITAKKDQLWDDVWE